MLGAGNIYLATTSGSFYFCVQRLNTKSAYFYVSIPPFCYPLEPLLAVHPGLYLLQLMLTVLF